MANYTLIDRDGPVADPRSYKLVLLPPNVRTVHQAVLAGAVFGLFYRRSPQAPVMVDPTLGGDITVEYHSGEWWLTGQPSFDGKTLSGTVTVQFSDMSTAMVHDR